MRLFSTTQLIAADQHSEFLMMDPDASQKGQVEAIFSGHNTHKSVSRPCHLEAGCHRGTVITIEKEASPRDFNGRRAHWRIFSI